MFGFGEWINDPAPGHSVTVRPELTSLIKKTSAEWMKLAEGTRVSAVIKASNVMVARE